MTWAEAFIAFVVGFYTGALLLMWIFPYGITLPIGLPW